MYYSHVNGRIVKPKNEQEASILKKDMTYQSVLDLYKTYDNEFYNIKNDGDFQDLEEKFNFNSLEKNSLLDLGNTKVKAFLNFDNLDGFDMIAVNKILKLDKDLEYTAVRPKDGVFELSMNDLLKLDKRRVKFQEHFETKPGETIITQAGPGKDVSALEDDVRDYGEAVINNSVEREALKNWYILNTDPADWRRTGESKNQRNEGFMETPWQSTKQFLASFGESVVETWTEDFDTIHSQSDKLTVAQKIGDELGVEWTPEQQKNFVQTTSEFSGQTLGAVPQIAVEFGILNAVTGGVASYTGLSESLMAMRMGRVIHRGKVVSRGKLLDDVYAATGSNNSKAVKDFLKSSANKYKYGKNIYTIQYQIYGTGGFNLNNDTTLGLSNGFEINDITIIHRVKKAK